MAQGIFTKRQQLRGLIEKSWVASSTPSQVEYLVVAGGGAGGGGAAYGGGGGGAGGLLQGIIPVTAGSSITVTVGAGGTTVTCVSGNNGNNSVFGTITAIGGGGGNYGYGVGACGGSGGGNGSDYRNPGPGTLVFSQPVAGQGNRGGGQNGSPGGGGGAGTAGICGWSPHSAGYGGAGVASAISGVLTTYAGGGGGAADYNACSVPILGGAGGGGNGAYSSTGGQNTAGSPNTGGGGGAANNVNCKRTASNGGSGIVIISYPDIYKAPASFGGANSPTASTSGSGSVSFNGTSSYFYYGGQSPFAFGTNNFTIECWVYFNNVSSTQILYDFRATSTNGVNPCVYVSAGLVYYYPAGANQITGTTTLSTNTWYHIALCRIGTSTNLYVNGVQQGSTYTDSNNYAVGANRPYIGSNGYGNGSSAWLNGYMSNLRMINGTALYTSAFTPPTAPLTPITNTILLLGTVSPNQYLDSSTNGYTPNVVNGSPTWTPLSPFATGLGYKNRVYTWTGSGTVTF